MVLGRLNGARCRHNLSENVKDFAKKIISKKPPLKESDEAGEHGGNARIIFGKDNVKNSETHGASSRSQTFQLKHWNTRDDCGNCIQLIQGI